MSIETVSKRDVARRQMNEAIRLFFEGRDAVAIHTLAAAAAQVLHDLCRNRGIDTAFRDGRMIRPEKQEYWRRILKASENFFKHADQDPDATHEFRPDVTEFFTFDATYMYGLLTQRQTYEGAVYQSWFFLNCPDALLDSEYKHNMMATAAQLGITGNDLKFFRQTLDAKGGLPRHVRASFD